MRLRGSTGKFTLISGHLLEGVMVVKIIATLKLHFHWILLSKELLVITTAVCEFNVITGRIYLEYANAVLQIL